MADISIGGLHYVESALTSVFRTTAVHAPPSAIHIDTLSTAQLSPVAQVTSTLLQLQKSDPTKYREVAQQIAASLHSDAHAAQFEGEISKAAHLTRLASAFATAGNNGELPNLPDLLALTAL
jgi:hypothetical protein